MENDDDDNGFFEDSTKDDYIKGDKLGEGSYGVVYKGIYKKNGMEVAIKKIKLSLETEGISSSTLREITTLRNLNHINIEKLIDVFYTNTKICLIYELMECNLKQYIEKESNISNSLIKKFMREILSGVGYCHSKKILHRDIKPENILLTKDLTIKIADFGFSRITSSEKKPYTNNVMSTWYKPPELLLGSENYNESADIWSIGCVFAYIVLGKTLFDGSEDLEQINKIFQFFGTPNIKENIETNSWDDYSSMPGYSDKFIIYKPENFDEKFSNLSNNGKDLLKKMLLYNPDKRISCKEALMHPYFYEE